MIAELVSQISTHEAPAQALLAQTFVGPEVNWFALSPMLTLLAGALGMMLVGSLTSTWPKGLYALVAAVTAGTAGALAMVQWDDITDNGPTTLVGGAIAFDTLAMFLTITICIGVLLVSMLTDSFLRGTPNEGPEIYALYLVAAIGGIVMASANDLIVLFLGLETLSLALYVLAASNRRSLASAESGIKYFVLGGFASAFFLYGIALLYGAAGTTNITEMVATFQSGVDLTNPNALALAGLALLIVGLGFKVAAAPFHVWTPDVYQGAPSPVTAFMASVGKAAAFAAMLRVWSRRCRSSVTTGARSSGCLPSCRCWLVRSSRWCRPTSSGCSRTRQSPTLVFSSWVSKQQATPLASWTLATECHQSRCT